MPGLDQLAVGRGLPVHGVEPGPVEDRAAQWMQGRCLVEPGDAGGGALEGGGQPALDRYYAGSQQCMAERLEVSKSWLSRYLELARLPSEVTAAFGSPREIGISRGALLGPLLRQQEQQARLIAGAACWRMSRPD